jgi:uncharacterized protein (TIGR03118 family)
MTVSSARQRWCRPILECLEDRCLLSTGFAQVDLASDVPGLARVTDPNLVNPWGIAFSPTGPFWFANNSVGVSDLLDGRGQAVPLVVAIPPSPTGVVFNGGGGFVIGENGLTAPSRFLFASEDGTISGWTSRVDPTHAIVAVDSSSSRAVYTGLALADSAGHTFLYAADFSRATIDVFDEDFHRVVRPGAFQNSGIPARFAPFNIQEIGNRLFVAYAQQDDNRRDDVAGPGHGFIDVFDPEGHLLQRFASQGPLNSPWGLALAPADFGPFAGALLVGNNGDGHISAYDPGSGAFLGQLADDRGIPIVIPNLWALTFGNGHAGGDSDTLFFAGGVDYDQHGLFGAIQSPQRKGADTAGSGVFDPHAPGEPGDYPLPPSGDPAFLARSDEQIIPVADLLPLSRGSPLLLVPTLSSLALSGPNSRLPVQSAPIGGTLASQSAMGATNDLVALTTLVDLNTSQIVAQITTGEQWPGPSTLADREGRTEEPQELLDRSSQEHPPQELPPLGQVAALAGGNEQIDSSHGNGWTRVKLIVFAGISVIGAYWMRASSRSRGSETIRDVSP